MNPVETLFMSPAFAEARRHLTRSQVAKLLDAARALSDENELLRASINWTDQDIDILRFEEMFPRTYERIATRLDDV